MAHAFWAAGGLLAGDLTKAEATRRVYLAAGGLIAIGVALTALTVWWWRSSRADHTALATLELMGERRFASSDDQERARLLASAHGAGAAPADGSTGPDAAVATVLPAAAAAGVSPTDSLREIDELLGLDEDELAALAASVPDESLVEDASSVVDDGARAAAETGTDGESSGSATNPEPVADASKAPRQAIDPILRELSTQN